MTTRFLMGAALAVASAFALTAATPAYACGKDCDCAKKASTKKPDAKPEVKPDAKPPEKPAATAPEKKAEATPNCECTKGGKGCVCPKGACKCPNCGGAAKFAAGDQADKKCDCAKGKDCACTKGECKCHKAAKHA